MTVDTHEFKHWVFIEFANGEKFFKKKKVSLLECVHWRTAWSCFSFVTQMPDFPVYAFIYLLYKICLMVFF